ncbi:hypothetical protein L873DRAFT_1004015 [Choiromyces venosus 120613-1]|uniref:Uncharacterized protein n=1 Tax=Choiromyces venosus 120613-1 TaxID=1336337 RepID=A0A3N4JY96_9PEZI|nr:hypothetical protein L873DRAFT_1004015 [Choiromyces venosus 120613-1]
MSLSMGLFSRRKNSEDKALRAALSSPHVSSFASSSSSNITTPSSSTHDGYPPFPLPPHSAPLTHSKKSKLLTKAHPISVPGYAADSGGIVFAPHLTRSRTTNFNSPTPTPQQQHHHHKQPSISGLMRSNSDASGSRRTRSLDQRAPQLGSHMEGFMSINPSSFPHPPSPDLPQSIPLPNSPAVFQNRGGSASGSGASTPRFPLSATGMGYGSHSNHGFYNPPGSGYPVSPPLSPESPLGTLPSEFDENVRKPEGELVMEIADLKKAISTRDHVIARYAANFNIDDISDAASGTKKSEGQRINQILSRRIRDLEIANLEKDNEITQAAQKLNSVREAQNAELDSLREAHAREVQTLRNAAKRLETPDGVGLEDLDRYRRREFELMNVVNGKEKELELLRANANTLRERVSALEKSITERDRELDSSRRQINAMSEDRLLIGGKPALVAIAEMGLAGVGRKLMDEVKRREKAERRLAESTMKSRSDLDAVLLEEERKREEIRTNAWRELEQKLAQEELKRHEARRKAKENIDYVLAEEEKRRTELSWQFNEKLETLRQEKEMLESRIANMEMELEQAKQSVTTQREGNESLIEMTAKINTRLGEEKKRNRQLEAKINQITEDALNNVSGSKRACQDLKNVVEDRETRITFLESEVAALKREKSGIEEAWHSLEAELDGHSATLAERDERIKDLETDNTNIRDRLEEYQHDLEEMRRSLPDRPIFGDSDSETRQELSNLQQDLELYKQDIKAYKRDVKKRDAQIRDLNRAVADLESLLDRKPPSSPSPLPPSTVSTPTSRSPTPTTASLVEEIATLKDKLRIYDQEYRSTYEDRESLRKKHATVTAQQNMIITDLDTTILKLRKEKEATEKTMKRMQANFLQLSQAAAAGTLATIRKYREVPLPPLPAGGPLVPGSPILPTSPVRRGSRGKEKGRSVSMGSPVIGSMSGGESEKEKEKEKERRDKTLSVVNEPDGALGEEEVIEW